MAKMNKNYGLFGLGLQTAQGTAATAPHVSFHASGDSNGISAERTLESVKLTRGNPVDVGSYISEIAPTFEATTLGFPGMLSLLAYAALGKVEDDGDAAPYAHTITPGESLPYLTVFEQKGASTANITHMVDSKVDSLSMTAEGVAPISFDMTINGCNVEWETNTTWAGPEFDLSEGWFTLADAEVLFSLTSGTPVAVPVGVNLSSLNVEIANSVEIQPVLGSAVPGDQKEGASTITCSIEGTTDSTELYREVMTGSSNGTSIASSVVTGSLQLTFAHSTQSDWSLVIKIPCIPWNCDVLSVSTDGGPFDLSLSTDGALAPSAGETISVIITDDNETIPGYQSA